MEIKQDGNTVSVEQKGLDKPLYILVVGTLMIIILVKVIVYSCYPLI